MSKKIEFRTPYNYDADAVSAETGRDCFNGSVQRTVQSQSDDVDINKIVARFVKTGVLPENYRVPSYEDFTEAVTDYHSAMNLVRSAQEAFERLPAPVRSRFDNDPGLFVDYMESNPDVSELEALGLVRQDARTVAAAAPAARSGEAPQGGAGASPQGTPPGGAG